VARKFVRMRIYRRATAGLNGETERDSAEGGFCPFCLNFPLARRLPSCTAPRNSVLFVGLESLVFRPRRPRRPRRLGGLVRSRGCSTNAFTRDNKRYVMGALII
jgi:hypothetical protein